MGTTIKLESIQISVAPGLSVSGSLAIPPWWPSGHRVGIVLGHDLGASIELGLLVRLQAELCQRGYLTLIFNFPFAEQGRKRPDPDALLERTLRSAAASLLRDPQASPARVLLGGMGLGARVAANLLGKGFVADGLLALPFPLHPSGKPNQAKAEVLFRIICPMLFIQGSRDPYCRTDRLELLLRRVGAPTSVHIIEDADHELGLIKRSTRSPEEVQEEILSTLEGFIQKALEGF